MLLGEGELLLDSAGLLFLLDLPSLEQVLFDLVKSMGVRLAF